jgi:hypothetical protein
MAKYTQTPTMQAIRALGGGGGVGAGGEIRCSDNEGDERSSAVEKRGFFYQHRACADARV